MSRQMKDSGIEWIGEIPEKWELKRLKSQLVERKEKNEPVKTDFILSLGANYGIIPYSDKEGGGNKAKEDLTDYRLAYPGDIVMNSMNILSGSVGMSEYFGCVSPVYYMFYPRSEEVCTEYFYLIFQSKAFQRSLLGLGNGILIKESSNGNFNTVRMRIPVNKLNSLMLPIPSYSEQKRIATYLGQQCAYIDAVIEKTKASIEEYKKLKQAVITQAVTKGIRGDRPMKDSGIEWIGEIPADWDCRKLRSLCVTISKGTTPKDMSTDFSDIYRIRYIKSENIVNNVLEEKPLFTITSDVHEGELRRSQLSVQDILFVIAGASIGKVAIVKDSLLPANTNQATSFIRINKKYMYSQKYIWYVLQSSLMKEYITLFAVQSAQPNISMEDLGAFKINMPKDVNETKELVEYLDEKCSAIDILIEKKEQTLTEMESYRKSLIYEYVTGKKEVPQSCQ